MVDLSLGELNAIASLVHDKLNDLKDQDSKHFVNGAPFSGYAKLLNRIYIKLDAAAASVE